jgi:single-strand selective monofunctional uracil DNA glycosylase
VLRSAAVDLVRTSRALCRAVDGLAFGPPVTHVYNPLRYAFGPYTQYLERFGAAQGRVVLLGMNPGPFGMVQSGVPFGEVGMVRDFLGIDAPVGRPAREHPKRPVEGLACTRAEVSGARLWGWARERYGTPARFFARFFIMNYCPLAFLEASGRNRTPDKLPKAEREPLFAACDRALVRAVQALAPRMVVGIGAFARARAAAALGDAVPIGMILHPSPASPRANRGWVVQAEADLAALGVAL